MNKKNNILSIILILILLIAGTYIWLVKSIKINKDVVIKKGSLSLVLDEKNNNKLLLNNDIKETTYYFKVKNKSNSNCKYVIYLDDNNNSELNEYINYTLTINNKEISTGLLSDLLQDNKTVLDKGVLSNDTTKKYTLKLWVDENVNNILYQGQINIKTTTNN